MGLPIFDSKIEKLKKYLDERMNPNALWEDRWAATDKDPFSDAEINSYLYDIESKLYQAYTQKGQMTQADIWKLGLQMDFLRAYHQAYINRVRHRSYFTTLFYSGRKDPPAMKKKSELFTWFKTRVDSVGETE